MRLNNRSQSGSALIYILVGVVLFAALMYSVLKGGSTSSNMSSKGNAKAQAAAIVEYARMLQGEVNRMLQNGVSENQIDMDSGLYSRWNAGGTALGGANPNCPNTSCKLFISKGGKIPDTNFRSAASNYPNMAYASAHPYPGDPVLSQLNTVGVGTSKFDLGFIIGNVNKDVCTELNKLVGAPSNAMNIDEGWGSFGIIGIQATGEKYYNFDQYTKQALGDNNTSLSGKTSACVPISIYGYVFYYVLLAR